MAKKLLGLFILIFFVSGCRHKAANSDDYYKSDQRKVNSLSNLYTEKQGNICPYSELDSLEKQLDKGFTLNGISKLDSICSKSDGDLSESCSIVSQRLFENHLAELTEYLVKHPNTCLMDKVILAYSEDFSAYDEKERAVQIRNRKREIMLRAKKEALSDKQVKVIVEIFSRVNPSIYD